MQSRLRALSKRPRRHVEEADPVSGGDINQATRRIVITGGCSETTTPASRPCSTRKPTARCLGRSRASGSARSLQVRLFRARVLDRLRRGRASTKSWARARGSTPPARPVSPLSRQLHRRLLQPIVPATPISNCRSGSRRSSGSRSRAPCRRQLGQKLEGYFAAHSGVSRAAFALHGDLWGGNLHVDERARLV